MHKTYAWTARLIILAALILSPTLGTGSDIRSPVSAGPAAPYVTGEILVQWSLNLTADSARASLMAEELNILQEMRPLRVARVSVPPGEELAYVERLSGHPDVVYAEPNYLAYASDGAPESPNDAEWRKQWNMRRVDVAPAWDLSLGKPEVVIAVLDSGIDPGHPELSSVLLEGYDFVNDDPDALDDYGHGTHVAGILAAKLNNQMGVAGVAPGVSLLPLKVLNDRGAGTYANIAAAIQYATAHGADIVNLSLGGASPSSTLEQAVNVAHSAGLLLVASAGNQGQNAVNYPARYGNVVAVAATDHYDRWTSYSNWGPEVDLAAPGGTGTDPVWSTWVGGYDWEYGSSMSAPHVSGAAALMWSVNPSLAASDIADTLRETADPVGQFAYVGGRNDYLGSGRLNVHTALRHALPPSLSIAPQQIIFLGDTKQAPAARRLALYNASYQSLQWTAAKVSGGAWFNLVAPLSGTISYERSGRLDALPSTGGLGYGYYEGSLRLSSTTPGAQGTPRTVPVYLSLVPDLTRIRLPALVNAHTHFEWLDISDSTGLALGDETSIAVALPWSFPFYGNYYDRLWVSDNGFVSFRQGYAGTAPDGTPTWSNSCLPSARQPNDVIYPFWDDLDPSKGGSVFAKAADSEAFVIEWLQVPHYDGTDPETFQVVLRSNGQITFQYLVVGDDTSVTVGMENYDGTMAWQWLCDGQGTRLRGGMAATYQPPGL